MKYASIFSISKVLGVMVLCLCGSVTLAQSIQVTKIELTSEVDAVDPVVAGREFWIAAVFSSGDQRPFTREMTGGLDHDEFTKQLVNGWSTHPTMFYQALPFNWDIVFELPVLNVLPNFPEHTKPWSIRLGDIFSIFNIEVILAEHHAYELPTSTLLIAELRFQDRAYQIDVPMILDEDGTSYYMQSASDFVSVLRPYLEGRPIVSPENPSPDFELREFQGFTFDEYTVKRMDPMGIPVAYNINIGSTTVKSGFQWGGKPEGMPLRYPQIPFLKP